MDPRIILAGQQPDIVGNMMRGQQFAANRQVMDDQNRLRQLFASQGPQIMAGDQNALAAFAQIDPMAAMNARAGNFNFEQARVTAAREAQRWAASLSEAERAQKAQAWEAGLMRGIGFYQSGDLDGLNAHLQSLGEAPLQSLDQFPALAAQAKTVLDALVTVDKLTNPEPPTPGNDYERYAARERAAGREPLDEFAYRREVAATKGGGMEIYDPATGNLMFRSGGGASETADQSPAATPGAIPPVEGAGSAFGLGGILRGLFNAGADALGAAVPFPETLQAQADINAAGETILSQVAAGYSRQPPSWLLQEIRALVPFTGNLKGSQSAIARYNALKRQLETDIQSAKNSLRGARNNPSRMAELQDRIQGGTNALALIEQISTGIQGGSEGNTTSSGIKWRVVE